MRSMLQIHRDARGSAGTIYHEFLACYSTQGKAVYAFFEGKEDPSFYLNALQSVVPHGWRIRRWCVGKKENVYDVHGCIDRKRFDTTAIVFFVDRDLCDVLKESYVVAENIYVTDYYSIENTLVSWELCHRILEELYGFTNPLQSEIDGVLGLFERALVQFCRCISVVMGWYVLCRNQDLRPCLDDIRIGDLVRLDSTGVAPLLSGGDTGIVDYCQKRCHIECTAATGKALQEAVEVIQKGNPKHRHIRGKYILWFVVQFPQFIHKEWARFFPTANRQPKVHLQLGLHNAMEALAPRARVPDSLAAFLGATVAAYVQKVASSVEVAPG